MRVSCVLTFWRASLCSYAVLVAVALNGFGQEEVGVPIDQPNRVNYAAVRGDHEFSGRMIVRPVQAVRLRANGLTEQQIQQRTVGAVEMINQYAIVNHVRATDEYIIVVPRGQTENDVANALLATGNFEYAEPDWILYPVAIPNDTFFNSQWQHTNMNSAVGWDMATGNPSISVGICDTGIRTTHQDFQLHRLEGYNAVDQRWESQGGDIGPVHPHGTMTTGCAAANGNNGVGIAGVGWNLSHRMLRVSNSSGGSSAMSTLQHAARTSIENGDKAASVSYSGVDNSSNLTTATYIRSLGGLLVWAAGNDGRNLTFGNRDNDDLIVVGATDSGNNKASFSAYGQFVDLVAPGVSVLTTDSGNDSDYAYVSGTSFSTPLTAGLAALIWSADPSLTPSEVELILKSGSTDLGSSGTDNTFGYGLINVQGSLSLVGGGGGNQSPEAVLTANPQSGTVGQLFSFDASGSSDPDGSIVQYEWDFDGDGTYDDSGIASSASWTYGLAGTYNAVVRVTDNGGATATDSITITVTQSGGVPVSIASEGFESRNFSGGAGNWVGNWVTSGDIALRWRRDNPHTGSGHVRLRRSTGYMERQVNLAGATSVQLTFWAKVNSFESNDRAVVQVSPDGVHWTPVVEFTPAQSDNTYHEYSFDLPSFNGATDLFIAFDANMSGSNDQFYVDDIEISGVQ